MASRVATQLPSAYDAWLNTRIFDGLTTASGREPAITNVEGRRSGTAGPLMAALKPTMVTEGDTTRVAFGRGRDGQDERAKVRRLDGDAMWD